MRQKTIRDAAIFIAVISLIFMLATVWFNIDLFEWQGIIELIAAVGIATGILVNTGEEPQPLTKERFVEKLKSPLAIGAIVILTEFILQRLIGVNDTSIVIQIIDTIIVAALGFSVYNNPNNRIAVR